MYEEFECCEHLLNDIYDFAIGNDIPVAAVDDAITQEYLQHKKLYERIGRYTGFEFEKRLMVLNLHVLEGHVMSELEQMAKRGGCCGGGCKDGE